MATLDLPGFGVFEGGRTASPRGRWALIPGGTVEVRPHRGPFAPWRARAMTLPLLSGALVVNEPVHLSIGEISVAVDKTRSVRLTLTEVIALGNRRYAVDVIASALGQDAGPDEAVRLEGSAARIRDGALRVALTGFAPGSLLPRTFLRDSPVYGPLIPGISPHSALIPAAAIPVAPRAAGVRVKLIATFGR